VALLQLVAVFQVPELQVGAFIAPFEQFEVARRTLTCVPAGFTPFHKSELYAAPLVLWVSNVEETRFPEGTLVLRMV
jgi:hypothetical protein